MTQTQVLTKSLQELNVTIEFIKKTINRDDCKSNIKVISEIEGYYRIIKTPIRKGSIPLYRRQLIMLMHYRKIFRRSSSKEDSHRAIN